MYLIFKQLSRKCLTILEKSTTLLKMKTFILDLRKLRGKARDVISNHAKHQLNTLGLTHASGEYNPDDAGISTRGNTFYSFGSMGHFSEDARVFDATTSLGSFIASVQKALDEREVETSIGGVKVKISREGIEMDVTEFLREVEVKAHQIRKETFNV